MGKCWLLIFFCFCFPALGSSDFDELGKNPEILKNSLSFSDSSLKVIQKRWLDRRFLSEISFGLSPALKGLNYIHNYSVDGAYRFFLSDQWSIDLKYSWFFNPIAQEGKQEVEQKARIPLELKYPQKQAFLGGAAWYPFYGKAVFYDYLAHFDLYLSVLGGAAQLLNLDKNFLTGSVGLGLVCWWHKNWNARLEIQAAYYKYDIPNNEGPADHEEYIYKIYISAGALF